MVDLVINMSDFNKLLWDRRFMQVAQLVSSWSKDPSTKVGSVLVRDKRIVATGYNGFPPGIADDDRLQNREAKYPRVVHAETNAILQAGHASRGATLYMYFPHGGAPCSNCAKHAITAGVARVVFKAGAATSSWAADQALAREMLEEAGVQVTEVEFT